MGSKKKGSSSGPPKDTMEYKEKRMKNNVAVKRSRDKTKQKAREAQSRVQQLQIENEHLNQTVDNMTSELRYLKDLLISQAGTSEHLSQDLTADLEDLLQDNAPRDLGKLSTVLHEVKRIHSLQKSEPGVQLQPVQHQQNNIYGTGSSSANIYQDANNAMYHSSGNIYDHSNHYL